MLRAGVELEGRPVIGLLEYVIRMGMQHLELRVAEGGRRILALTQFGIKGIHQLWRRGVANFPKRADDIVRPGPQESPGKPYEPFTRIGTSSQTITRGNRHQIRMERALNDVSRIQFVRSAIRAVRA